MTTKITTDNIAPSTLTSLGGPKISTIVYPGTETATDTAGGETITLNGTGFLTGCTVLVASTSASVVTFVSSTQITFTAPALSAGTYVIYVINTDGGTAISIPGISYSGTPNWTTTAGSLGTAYETGSISTTVTATGDAPITYTLASGTLPTGSTLSSSGSLSGTAPSASGSTQYSFTITAKDAQNQITNRAFSLTISPDVVTWNSPADGTSTALTKDTAMANVTLSATSAAGKSITYTANALPTGVTITGALVNGTPTVTGTTNSLITATSATTNKTATRNFSWVVSGTYCVLNPLDNNGLSVSNANLTISSPSANSTWYVIRGSLSVSSGKWYWEFSPTTLNNTNDYAGVGIFRASTSLGTDYLGSTVNGYGYYSGEGSKSNNNSSPAYGASYGAGDVIGVALNMDAGTLIFYKNNASQGTAYSGLSGSFSPAFGLRTNTGGSIAVASVNFGQSSFRYTPPVGYLALNS